MTTSQLVKGTRIKYRDSDKDGNEVVRDAIVNGEDYTTHIMCWVFSLGNNVSVAKANIVSKDAA